MIIPSNRFIESGEEKDEILYKYKTILQTMPCKHFNFGEGKCPFLNSCFYAHQLKYVARRGVGLNCECVFLF